MGLITNVVLNTDEINAFLLRGMTPMEYCKTVISDTVQEIQEYLTADNENEFNGFSTFDCRSCCIYMKNLTHIWWDIEMLLEQVVLPDLDQIEYVEFYGVPWKKPVPGQPEHPWDYRDLLHEFHMLEMRNMRRLKRLHPFDYHDDRESREYRFDSARGAFLYKDVYYNSEEYKLCHDSKSHDLTRNYPDYQVSVRTPGEESDDYFASLMDAGIGAFIAEQILLSNTPEKRSLEYGIRTYKSKAIHVFPLNEPRKEINHKDCLAQVKADCSRIMHKLSRSISPSRKAAFMQQRNILIAEFINLYLLSLDGYSAADNFTLLYPIFSNNLKAHTPLSDYETDSLIQEISAVCHTNYCKKPVFDKPKTPLQHFQAAVWALVNSTTYMEAISNILNFVDFQHEGQLAVTLAGAFAGIYYQYYRIPQKYLTENRYYTHFSNSIIPMEKIRFYG